ncbi:hypothetical protein HYALB_00004373 [Hymenoscyphus albidus]|uniref:Sulfatase-modifying factor enzyme domain-containing protein n=1 Tax=Hymenoscyphus albidus TaxID=595503 RepID=A0A9N9LKH3_9HELO|nr:hypothetical protein HYALB_00004373 [Hymenoscyphus albidus]
MVNIISVIPFLFLTLTTAQDPLPKADIFYLTTCEGWFNSRTAEILYFADKDQVNANISTSETIAPTYNFTLPSFTVYRNRTREVQLGKRKFSATIGVYAEEPVGTAQWYDLDNCDGQGTTGYSALDCRIANYIGNEPSVWIKDFVPAKDMNTKTTFGAAGNPWRDWLSELPSKDSPENSLPRILKGVLEEREREISEQPNHFYQWLKARELDWDWVAEEVNKKALRLASSYGVEIRPYTPEEVEWQWFRFHGEEDFYAGVLETSIRSTGIKEGSWWGPVEKTEFLVLLQTHRYDELFYYFTNDVERPGYIEELLRDLSEGMKTQLLSCHKEHVGYGIQFRYAQREYTYEEMRDEYINNRSFYIEVFAGRTTYHDSLHWLLDPMHELFDPLPKEKVDSKATSILNNTTFPEVQPSPNSNSALKKRKRSLDVDLLWNKIKKWFQF